MGGAVGKIIRWVLVLVVAFVALVGIASHFGGELVTLQTAGEMGVTTDTTLWVVDDAGAVWVRAGNPNAGWLARIEARPEVKLERDGQWRDYRATPVPGGAERINALMAEKYGWAESVISLIHDENTVVPVRLDPSMR